MPPHIGPGSEGGGLRRPPGGERGNDFREVRGVVTLDTGACPGNRPSLPPGTQPHLHLVHWRYAGVRDPICYYYLYRYYVTLYFTVVLEALIRLINTYKAYSCS